MHGPGKTTVARAAAIAAALLCGATSAPAQERGPLTLASASYFFVGGKIDTSVEGSPVVGQMYVEYMIPAKRSHPYPIVMVHGGSQTGTNFTGTPDGREGWAQYFVRRGYAVYVVDQVARGRAALLVAGPRPGARPRASISSSSASWRPSASSNGRRRICTRNGRAPASRAIPRSISSTPRNFLRS